MEIKILAGKDLLFTARLETESAPNSCSAFVATLPFRAQFIHARWSGEAVWIPAGRPSVEAGVRESYEPSSAGEQILLYPGGLGVPELLLPYGATWSRARSASSQRIDLSHDRERATPTRRTWAARVVAWRAGHRVPRWVSAFLHREIVPSPCGICVACHSDSPCSNKGLRATHKSLFVLKRKVR